MKPPETALGTGCLVLVERLVPCQRFPSNSLYVTTNNLTAMCPFMIKIYDMDFVVRVLAGFKLEEMLVVMIEPMNRHNIHAVAIYRQRYRNCRPYSLQSSSKNVSIFYHEQSICSNHRSHGCDLEVPCVYHLYGPNVYVDKMELFEFLLADGHYNLCN